MKTLKGPAIFLAQFIGDKPPFDKLDTMAKWVADLGYRLLYLPKISNYAAAPNTPYYLNDNTVHELRGTVRYRFN